ncbi:phosphatidylinositol-glycan biosynthesis class X protein [Scaptodrosophila lebanonensis]|uniref:Phosphatidylinositol-glycan biosynthesis class X protein n=1 Tax=Drosophila lebanonensis TaxID=7225 RepID=A0A6J2U5N4_DROLE|nr:phosphatidylinositol-glycan biosynthesis class X protein [Scaptodrosophila lebanonensis]
MELSSKLKYVMIWKALILMATCGNCDQVQLPIVDIKMEEAGMHRTITYTVQFHPSLVDKDCKYILKQSLPAAVFVSTDELDDLQRLNKLVAVYPKFVDIEQPTEKANAFTVLLRGSPKITDTLTLPIHFRYHAPSDNSSYASVVIDTPVLYANCPATQRGLMKNELLVQPDKLFCLNYEIISFEENLAREEKDTEQCSWKQLHADYQPKSALRAEIPVGNSRAFPPILYATITLSWALSIWTVIRTRSVPRRINYRLNDQRLLQQKVK